MARLAKEQSPVRHEFYIGDERFVLKFDRPFHIHSAGNSTPYERQRLADFRRWKSDYRWALRSELLVMGVPQSVLDVTIRTDLHQFYSLGFLSYHYHVLSDATLLAKKTADYYALIYLGKKRDS